MKEIYDRFLAILTSTELPVYPGYYLRVQMQQS